MKWIPEGALVAGTPPGQVPRVADEEMPGTRVQLHGFFMDRYAYPNEEGAIPTSGVIHSQAVALCETQGKRLCTELEWERACKGPRNTTYEYGEQYRAEPCLTGRAPRMLPSGYRTECRSEFGVRDLHGGLWEWTQSEWGRGSTGKRFSLRGGNADDGELVGRCANAMGRPASYTSSRVGFRCCKGEVNPDTVRFKIETGPALRSRWRFTPPEAEELESLVPDSAREELRGFGPFQILRIWNWRPVGNEELVVGTGCAGQSPRRRCAVVVARVQPGRTERLAWMWVGKFPPVAKVKKPRRRLWVYGGDRVGHYKHAMWFEWGRVREGELIRNKPD